MLRSLYSGVSGLRNHQQAMDVIGNNIANVNTPGFKSSRVTFMDTLSQTLQGVQQARATMGGRNPMQVGSGMTVAAIDKNMGQGSLQSTGRNLDLAIEGRGFFIVGNEENYYYTRLGALSVDDQGNLVTNTGELIYGWVDTNQDGTISSTQDELQWINLDRRGDGKITNVLAHVGPVIPGANAGDASLSEITPGSSTITDNWTVEAIKNPNFDPSDSSKGPAVYFTVRGEKSGYLEDASGNRKTFSVGDSVTWDVLGEFTINGNQPKQASYDFALDASHALSVTAVDFGAGGNEISLEFVNEGPSRSLSVSVSGQHIRVVLATDASGVVTSTLGDVIEAINRSDRASALVRASTSGLAEAQLGPTDEPDRVRILSKDGAAWTVTLTNSSSGDSDISVSVNTSASTITVELADDGSGNITSTWADVIQAINDHAEASQHIVAARGDGYLSEAADTASVTLSAGTGTDSLTTAMTEFSKQYLQNGAGPDVGDSFTFSTTAPGGATVENLTITRDGTIIGTFDNGTTEELARIAIANIPNPEGLFSLGGGKFAETPTSGTGFPPVQAGTQGAGTIASGYLEMSNVDLTREFTDMIVVQRGFQANSRIITTSDEMLQDLLALKR